MDSALPILHNREPDTGRWRRCEDQSEVKKTSAPKIGLLSISWPQLGAKFSTGNITYKIFFHYIADEVGCLFLRKNAHIHTAIKRDASPPPSLLAR